MTVRPLFYYTLIFLYIFLTVSCTTYKNIPYFTDFNDTTKQAYVPLPTFKSPIIQPDDLLAITIQTLEPEVNALLNIPNTATSEGGSVTAAAPVYLVDKNGEVELPFTGKIKVQGFTTVEAKEVIRTEMAKYVQAPIINIKFTNFKIIVMGEVLKPDTYVMPTEKVTIFDAISKAGDITLYGKRESVVLIRDLGNEQKTMVHLDLNSKSILNSPWFYLQSNDIIYVAPNNERIASSEVIRTRNISIGLASLSLIITFLTFLKR